jgi:hypothetical protein
MMIFELGRGTKVVAFVLSLPGIEADDGVGGGDETPLMLPDDECVKGVG